MILCSAEPCIISCLPTHVINLVINDNSLEILYIYFFIYDAFNTFLINRYIGVKTMRRREKLEFVNDGKRARSDIARYTYSSYLLCARMKILLLLLLHKLHHIKIRIIYSSSFILL